MGQQHSHDHGGNNHGHSHGAAEENHGHSHGATQQHGHSHGGKPCHGHGPAAQAPPQQHGHSHGGKPCHGHGPAALSPAQKIAKAQAAQQQKKQAQQQQHGHSHGGKPCHGHGPAAQAPPQQQHGHSHGGKPCHGHGPAAQQPAPQQHGHSHGGKPCHGHGPAAQQPQAPQPQSPEEVEQLKKQKGVQLFLTQMVQPKIPIAWAHFHKNENRDESKATTSGGLTVPFVEGETMNREEFHEFIEQFLLSQAQVDGTNMFRFLEVLQTEMTFLMQLGFQQQAQLPDAEIDLPYQVFFQLFSSLTARLSFMRYDAIPFFFKNCGLDFKLPNLPLLAEEKVALEVRKFSREKIMPALIEFVEKNQEANQGEGNMTIASGFIALTNSIEKGVNEYLKATRKEALGEKAGDEDLWTTYKEEHPEIFGYVTEIILEIGNLAEQAIADPEEVLGQLKVLQSDTIFHADLIAANAQQLIIMPLLDQNPVALQYIAKEWGIELTVDIKGKTIPPPQ